MPDQQPGVELALMDVRKTLEVGFAETRGSLALLLQRAEQTDTRLGEQAVRVEKIDGRLHTVETTAITKAELDARNRRVWTVVSVLVTAGGVITAAATTVIVALMN